MIRSNLDYCSTIWSPYQRDQKHQVEIVQRRSARFVTNRYRNTSSVTDMLDFLGWESHETTRRNKLQLIVLYKIVHGLIDIPPTNYLTQTQTNSRTRSARKYKQYSSRFFQVQLFPEDNPTLEQTTTTQHKLRLPPWCPSRGSCLT